MIILTGPSPSGEQQDVISHNQISVKIAALITRNDDYIKERDVDVRAVVAETLRQRGFPAVDGDEAMDES